MRVGKVYALRTSVKLGVFIERDGLLNEAPVERQFQVSPLTLEDFRLNREAAPLLQPLKAAGLVVIATTNQPGLSRGYQSRRELERMHELLRDRLPVDDILVCPHDETDHCTCRKPKPGLLVEAAHKWCLDLERSYIISNKWQDAEMARAVGCTSFLVQSPWLGNVHRDFLLPGLAAAVEKLLRFRKSVPALLLQ